MLCYKIIFNQHSPTQNNGNRIIEHTFAENQSVHIHIYLQITKYGQYRQWICWRDQCTEVECVQKCETIKQENSKFIK